MRFRCSATFIFPPPEPFIGCGMGTTPGVILSVAPNTYWNLTSDTGPLPFTNSMAFPIEVGNVICVDGSGDVVSNFPCTIESQFLADGIPLTNKFSACPQGGLTAALAQFLVNSNLINPNATITTTDLGAGGIQAVVTINDNISHTVAQLEVFVSDVPVFAFEAPFVCAVVKKKKRRPGALQPLICIPANRLPNSPTYIRYKPNNQIYEFAGKDQQGNYCYKLFVAN